MSATRLLMLGLVRSFGRTNGYQVRQELHGLRASSVDLPASTRPAMY
ncbi:MULTISPECIES: hypothetical protein [Actinoalloteichus]|nr:MULTISPECIES: hypothetical protein [Actinoalloteichus]